jgi:hypothetical protein
MVRMYYGKCSLRWIGDQLGCSVPTVSKYAEQLGLCKPNAGEERQEARVPFLSTATPVSPRAIQSSAIPPPTREQLMAGSANPRRVYKVEG